jgi:hypothetical protein
MRQELAQYLPQQSVRSAISSTEQRELFAFFIIAINWGVSLKDQVHEQDLPIRTPLS